MNHHRLIHTTAMRLALRYALFYAVLTALGLGTLYWATSGFIDIQISVGLEYEIQKLKTLDQKQGRPHLATRLNAINDNSGKNRRYYLLDESKSGRQQGNLLGWPSQLEPDGKVHSIWVEHELIPGNDEADDGYWPMIAIVLDDGSRLLVAQGIHEAEDLQEFILSIMAVIFIVSVGLALIMGWRLGSTLLVRIDRINETAQKVTAGDLSHRTPLSGRNDEFDELAGHLNTMLKRIENLMTGMRQVSDNVAHDLRKPLTRMRNRIEVTLLEERDGDEYRRVMNETLEDANELMRTFNVMLEIAQAESGSFRGEWGKVNLSTLLENLAELYEDQAEELHQVFSTDIEPGLSVNGNRDLLAQSISNLLENAFKYTHEHGEIHLQVKRVEGQICVFIYDNGPGIPVDQRDKVLHRFTRLEAARSTPGNGLGLSLVKAIADLHNAELQLKDNQPGLCVILCFADDLKSISA
jgi:signal transduction histidine kinase